MKLITKFELSTVMVFTLLTVGAFTSLTQERAVKVKVAKTAPRVLKKSPSTESLTNTLAHLTQAQQTHHNLQQEDSTQPAHTASPELVSFKQQTKPYRKHFDRFVYKVKTAQTITSYLPECVTSAINWSLEKCGSQYKLDAKEMEFLDRFFSNKERYKCCIYKPEEMVDHEELKAIFEEFNKTSGEFKDFKKILKRFTIRSIPTVEDRSKRHLISDQDYYKVVTTNFMATHLYDQGFRA